jgi:hypothetical protein
MHHLAEAECNGIGTVAGRLMKGLCQMRKATGATQRKQTGRGQFEKFTGVYARLRAFAASGMFAAAFPL